MYNFLSTISLDNKPLWPKFVRSSPKVKGDKKKVPLPQQRRKLLAPIESIISVIIIVCATKQFWMFVIIFVHVWLGEISRYLPNTIFPLLTSRRVYVSQDSCCLCFKNWCKRMQKYMSDIWRKIYKKEKKFPKLGFSNSFGRNCRLTYITLNFCRIGLEVGLIFLTFLKAEHLFLPRTQQSFRNSLLSAHLVLGTEAKLRRKKGREEGKKK